MFFPTEIAYAAHLGGLFVGIAIGIFYRRQFKQNAIKIKKSVNEQEINEWEEEYMMQPANY